MLQKELSDLRGSRKRIASELEVLKADLAGYECDGYEHFKNNVLTKERIRIALVRMQIDPGKINLHERLQGQFNEVESLMESKAVIERKIFSLDRNLGEVLRKIEKLNKQLENRKSRIERK